ncbi:MAG: TolC family protein [Bacteroidales bacterium]|nr:TolC family protein [Bacteroidales bacterium]
MRKKVFSNIKRLSLVVCLFAISQVGHAQQESQATLNLDLTTALKIAHDNNPTIKIAELEIQRVDYAKKEALGNLLPSLSASGQYTNSIMKSVMFMPESFSAMMGGQKYMEIGYKNSYTGTVSAALPLVNFSLWEQIKSKQNEIDLILEQARASKIDMTKQVKDAYFAVLLAKNSLKVLERSINNAKETLKTTQTSFEQGVVSDNEVCAVSLHKRVLNLVLLGQLFFRDHLVCLDESDTSSMGHSDIDLPKSIFTGAAYTRLKVCHIDVYLMVNISLILTNLRW